MENAQGSGGSQKTRKPIFLRWWFWPGLLVLFAVTWYFQGYIEWFGDQAKYRIQNSAREAYLDQVKSQDAALEAKYKADTYGGTTPEETLRMFIEALEKKDYVLASKYYLVEDQSQALDDLQTSEQNGYVAAYLSILSKTNKGQSLSSGQEYAIEFFSNEGEQVHFERFKLNTFTNKWKLEL